MEDGGPRVEHVPVLLGEVMEWLGPRPGGRYIDATLGDGGHANALLERSSPFGTLLGLDADHAALAAASERLHRWGARATLAQTNFRHLAVAAERSGFASVDGIVIDLGFSSRQIERSGRGFSFRVDEPLDMRYDASAGTTAADIVNGLAEGDLADLFFQYGEERLSRRVARAIIRSRATAPIRTSQQLASVVAGAMGPRRGRLHPATRVFQALRIATNDELGALDEVLPVSASLLCPGGKLAVISFHSLEDRRVKRFFRDGGTANCPVRALTKRPVTPSREEQLANPRSRSAKLRVAERVAARRTEL